MYLTNPRNKNTVNARGRSDSGVEITPEMIIAGAEVLATWKTEDDYISEKQAVKEILEAMTAAFAKKDCVPQIELVALSDRLS